MAANLTPQYRKAEEEYRRAATPEDELRWLEVMLREIPKHKSSEKLQSDLKTKISRLKKEAATQKAAGKRTHSTRIPRQGAGTVVLLGGPNAGKSALVAAMTRATPEVAPYPFTTREPAPGMMPYEDVYVQLIDTPPVTPDYFEPAMHGLIRAADLALLMVDLGNDDGIEQCQDVLTRLGETKTRLDRTSHLDENDIGISYTAAMLVPNKIDSDGADERLDLLHELVDIDLPECVISAEQGTGCDELRGAIYTSLDVVRVYTKTPNQKASDHDRPYTVRRGGTVHDVASQIHNELAANLKFARIWGSEVHDATVVKPDHVVADGDVVELHE